MASYLRKYYKQNNPFINKICIDFKIIKACIICFICSLLYFVISKSSKISEFQGELRFNQSLKVLNIIMLISLIVGFIGIVFLILYLIPKKITNRIAYNTKKGFFEFLDVFSLIPICVLVTIFCFSYLFIITPVDGSSMSPTISNNEQVFVSYHSKIKPGSIVVLEVNPDDNAEVFKKDFYIKRVVGLPGDTISWDDKEKILKINGVKETYLSEEVLNSFKLQDQGKYNYHNVLEDDIFYVEDGQKIYVDPANGFKIPEGYYFVMGDNRSIYGSLDSRKIGLIKEENIIGVAKRKMFYVIPQERLQ